MGGVELLSREVGAIARGEAGKDVMLIAFLKVQLLLNNFLNGMKNYRKTKF